MIDENLKIEIRPVPGRNGIREYSDSLEYFSQAHTIQPFVDPVSRKYSTGLSEEDIKYLKEVVGVPYNLANHHIPGEFHEFWEGPLVKMDLVNTPMFLYPGKNPLDFIKYKYLLVNSYIYNSEKEMKTGSKPLATHYIYDEAVEMKIKATKIDRKNSLLEKVRKLTPAEKRNLILIIFNETTDNKDEDYLTVRFEDILSDLRLTDDLEELLNSKKKDVKLMADIRLAVQKAVIRRTSEGFFYFETRLGYSEDEVRENLSKPENQEVLLNIQDKIK